MNEERTQLAGEVAEYRECLCSGAGGCEDSPGCAPLAQSGASVRAVPPDSRTGQETVHPATIKGRAQRIREEQKRQQPRTAKTGYGTLTGACHFLFENDRRFFYFQEDLVECI